MSEISAVCCCDHLCMHPYKDQASGSAWVLRLSMFVKDLSTLPSVQHVPLHITASARAAAAAVDAFHISDGHSGLGSRRGAAFANSRESNARRRMSLDNSALDPAAGWPVTGQSMEGYALTYVAQSDHTCHKVHV